MTDPSLLDRIVPPCIPPSVVSLHAGFEQRLSPSAYPKRQGDPVVQLHLLRQALQEPGSH